jgi:hypothetical protein
MRLAANGAPVAVKSRAVEPVNKVKILLVLSQNLPGGIEENHERNLSE